MFDRWRTRRHVCFCSLASLHLLYAQIIPRYVFTALSLRGIHSHTLLLKQLQFSNINWPAGSIFVPIPHFGLHRTHQWGLTWHFVHAAWQKYVWGPMWSAFTKLLYPSTVSAVVNLLEAWRQTCFTYRIVQITEGSSSCFIHALTLHLHWFHPWFCRLFLVENMQSFSHLRVLRMTVAISLRP